MGNSLIKLGVDLIVGIIFFPIIYFVYIILIGAVETVFGWNPIMDIDGEKESDLIWLYTRCCILPN